MSQPQRIYSILHSAADWAAILNHDPHVWFYDSSGRFRVEPEVIAARADPKVWTEAGYDVPPRSYPGIAVRLLAPEGGPEPTSEEAPKQAAAPTRKRRRRHGLGSVERTYTLATETPEQIDCLCEVYRLSASAVIRRLVADAYRRDVVESGALSVLGDDDGIIAPRP